MKPSIHICRKARQEISWTEFLKKGTPAQYWLTSACPWRVAAEMDWRLKERNCNKNRQVIEDKLVLPRGPYPIQSSIASASADSSDPLNAG